MSRPVNISETLTSNIVSHDTSSYSYASITSASNGYAGSSNTSYATVNLTTGSSAETYVYWNFTSFDIPTGATINSVSCTAKCYINSTNSNYINTRLIRLYSGTTAMGSNSTVSNNTNTITLSAGTWTAAQLANARIRIYAKRASRNTSTNYYFRFYGATINVSYTYNGYIYEITATSDSLNITVSPASLEVNSGESASVRISGDLTNATVTDNNTDVTSLLVLHQWSNPSYTVGSVSGASYGFTLTNGWYQSQNAGVSNSAALCRVNLNLSVPCNITFTYINYAEATYDFGVFSKLDTALSTSAWTSTSNSGDTTTDAGLEQRRLNTSSYNTSSQQTLTYSNVSAGEHFIDVKFGKDQSTNSNNDTLRFQVSITPLETVPTGYYYEYTLSNVQADHTIAITTAAPVAVTGVTLNLNSASIIEEGTVQLTATVSPNDASNKNVTWSSSNTLVATVSNGLVTGVSAGSATITVTTVDGNYTATCAVTVTALPRTEYVLASSMIPGNTYVVANGNTGLIYMMSNESGGSRQLVGVAITVSNGSIFLTSSLEDKCAFSCIEYTSGNSVTTTLESDNKYLYCDNSSGLRFQTSSALDRFWHYNSNKFWQFKNSESDGYSDTSSEYKYYLTLNSSNNFTDDHVSTTSIENSTNLPAIYLFEPASQSGTPLHLKVNGSWTNIKKIYLKVSGSWTEVSVTSLTDSKLYYYKGSL